MDDPWGSPWGSSDAPATKPEPHPSPDNSLLCPPPRAFFGNTLTPPLQTPWADNGGFGDWASPAHPEESSSPGWGPWGDSGLTPRAESPGKQSPIAWPSSAATSPGLKPLRSRASSLFRQPSPDPWASESTWNERSVSPLHSRHLSLESPRDKGITATPDVTIHVAAPELSEEPTQLDNKAPQDELLHTSTLGVDREEVASPRTSCDGPGAGLGLMVETDSHKSPSRPPSTFSVESDAYPDQQDSPITSIDEETRAHPPTRPATRPARSASVKVSHLVGMYDGLTRAVTDDSPEPERRGSAWLRSGGGEDKYETRPSSAGNAAPRRQDSGSDGRGSPARAPSTASSDRSSTPKSRFKDAFGPINDAPKAEYRTPAPKASSVPVQELVEKFGVIKFPVDLSGLDKLFPDAPQFQEGDMQSLSDVYDGIITDSFTTVDERKMWYRVSRYGSMRKHNSGDDENYHRVSWQSSEVRTDLMKIVRRWMEEGSFSGGPTLVGGKRTSVFNWGSSSAPVNLEQVFARKPLASHSRTSSTVSRAHAPSPSVGSLNSIVSGRKMSGDSISVTAPSPIPSFGWSTASPAYSSSTISRFNSTSIAQKPPLQESKLKKVLPPIAIAPPPPVSAVPAVQASPTQDTSNRNDTDDEDDDWGDMVFSPVQEEFTDPYDDDTASSHAPGSGALLNKESASAERNTIPRSTPQSTTDLAERSSGSQDFQTAGAGPHPAADADSWASADFSVFEGSLAADLPTPKMEGPAASGTTSEQSLPDEHLRGEQTDSDGDAKAAAPVVNLFPIQKSKEQDEAEIVRQIVLGLPDLSYMLR